MAKKELTLSDGSTVTISIKGFTRADWQNLAKAPFASPEYDKYLAKMVDGYTGDTLRALEWVDWKAIDTAAGELLKNPVSADPS